MVTKKNIIRHGLWGGFFGLIGGIITGYAGGFGASWIPRPFPANIEQYIIFLIPGIFLGLALGIADKSIKKTFYGVLGGLIGGLILHVLFSMFKNVQTANVDFESPFYLIVAIAVICGILFSPIIYIISICSAFGIMYKSFHKGARGIISSIISLAGINFLVFFLLIGYELSSAWASGSYEALSKATICLLLGYTLWGISLTTGIFIGTEWGEKES